ncbi:MAG: hypothetical protein M1812_001865 [Candelaria pacifica]|nr:MAG: hypothetical protein M1812_001865 [Candelaria pacifica]
MNSHPSWLKQEHDDEDPDEAYTAGDQLVYDNRRIRHLTQGFSTQQYQHLSTLGHLSPDPHPHHAVSSQNPLAYRPEYSQAQYHLQDSYSTGASLDDYSHYQANQVHFDEFAGIVPYNNHVMATPNATPAASPIISRLQLITSDGLPTERQFEYLVTEYVIASRRTSILDRMSKLTIPAHQDISQVSQSKSKTRLSFRYRDILVLNKCCLIQSVRPLNLRNSG